MAAVADPEAVRLEPLTVPTLDAAGAHDFSRRGRTVDALVDLDAARVLRGLRGALLRLPTG